MKETVIVRSVNDPVRFHTVAEKLAASVDNSGNQVFQNAIIRQIVADRVVSDWEEVDDRVGTAVLTLANFIRPDIVGLVDESIRLERSHIERVILVGVGAQAYEYDGDLKIAPAAMRILKVASERSHSIGVRGFYTAELLNKNGIKNVSVVGCPSLFLLNDPDFCTPRDRQASNGSVVIHSTPTGYYRDKISELLAFGHAHVASYVAQNEAELVPLTEQLSLTMEQKRSLSFFTSYYNNGSVTPEVMQTWLKQHTKVFFDVKDWMAFLRRCRLSIGSRFHGNILALLAGVPALTLFFDTRTREMCEYLGLPSLPLECFNQHIAVERYIELGSYDSFYRGYNRKYAAYYAFLEQNGLKHSLLKPQMAYLDPISLADRVDPHRLVFDANFSDGVKRSSVVEYCQSQVAGLGADRFCAQEISNRLWTERSLADRLNVESR